MVNVWWWKWDITFGITDSLCGKRSWIQNTFCFSDQCQKLLFIKLFFMRFKKWQENYVSRSDLFLPNTTHMTSSRQISNLLYPVSTLTLHKWLDFLIFHFFIYVFFNSFSQPIKLLRLSEKKRVLILPVLAMTLLRAWIKESVTKLWVISICTALFPCT